MSQDPNAQNKPSSEPSYETPPPDPYGAPPSYPYSSPAFYEEESAAPPPDPYSSAPLTPDPYSAPPPVPGYEARQEYYYDVPSMPLPLGEAIRQLLGQYRRVLTRPSVQTFIAEMGKAAWNIVWVQLIVYAVIAALLAWLGLLINPAAGNMGSGNSVFSPAIIKAIYLASSIGLVVFIPLVFFIHQGITYLIARAFNGNGTFVRQAYSTLLIQVPLGIVSSLLGLIPILGILTTIAALIYQIVLSIFAIMAVHRLSGGKATTVVILPVVIVGLLFCVISFVLGVIFAAAR